MRKIKNKKRLTILAITFMLVFLIGSAFAITPGVLDIFGRIILAEQELYVVWCDTGPSLSGSPVGNITQTASVLPWPIYGRTRQRIAWNISFTGPGTASLTAQIHNIGLLDANIYDWSIDITNVEGNTDFGLQAIVNSDDILGRINAGTRSTPLNVDVFWGGTGIIDPTGLNEASIIIEFMYEPVW